MTNETWYLWDFWWSSFNMWVHVRPHAQGSRLKIVVSFWRNIHVCVQSPKNNMRGKWFFWYTFLRFICLNIKSTRSATDKYTFIHWMSEYVRESRKIWLISFVECHKMCQNERQRFFLKLQKTTHKQTQVILWNFKSSHDWNICGGSFVSLPENLQPNFYSKTHHGRFVTPHPWLNAFRAIPFTFPFTFCWRPSPHTHPTPSPSRAC